jgi:glycosyltransferase involved in cell wall biosynthesis
MNILFAVPYVPSLVRVRPYNLIRGLTARGHNVTVATLWTNDSEREDLNKLRECCADVQAIRLPVWRSYLNCLRALSTGEPLQSRYSWSPDLLKRAAALKERVDVVHVEHLRGARYGLSLRDSQTARSIPVVWDSVDCISDLFEQAVRNRRDSAGRWINQLELSRTRRYEGRAVSRFDRVLVTSPVDKESLLKLAELPAGRDPVTVLPNGVDLDYFTPFEGFRQSDTVVFSGKMSYHANESAVLHLIRDVMPRVWAKRPSTRVVIAGKDPSRSLSGVLAAYGSRVTLTGSVPDLRPHLREASVAAVPLVYGAGCQNKVLEAMACGTPVIATSKAVSSLMTEHGRSVLVADGPEAFAESLLALLSDPQRQRAIGLAGRRYVETHHRWDRIALNLETVYSEAIGARTEQRATGMNVAYRVENSAADRMSNAGSIGGVRQIPSR